MRVPVILISGFLGAGKTTLLVRLLKAARDAGMKPAVLMNEAGAISIDGPVAQSGGAIEVLNVLGGCICCTLKGDLHVALQEIARDVKPELLFIETTGIADPVEVLDTCTALDLLDKLDARGLVAVLDVEHGLEALRINDLARRQLELAQVIVLNKMDFADPAWFPRLQARVSEIAPGAEQINTVHCEVDAGLMLKKLLALPAPSTGDSAIDSLLHEAHGHDQDHGYLALSYRVSEAPSKDALLAALRALPENVIRAKGFVRLRGEDALYICQLAGGHAQAHVFPLQGFDPEPTLVIIGRELNRAAVEAALQGLSPIAV
jgi:G3E family GTPase